ncbi:MAG: DUF615 domain-containing protein [Sulfuriflexus sp.]|nr:DUF615 domain-containing protein [Sulfuriflexus sp.]
MPDDDELIDNRPPSKSQRKRDMHAQFDLGKVLVELPISQLKKLSLDESLYDAIDTCRNIRQHGARKRQHKLISKLLSEADTVIIQDAIDGFKAPQREAVAELHAIEDWRDRLITEDHIALTEFISNFPAADRQQLRQILRNAKQTKSPDRNKRAKRELFQLIRDLVEAN